MVTVEFISQILNATGILILAFFMWRGAREDDSRRSNEDNPRRGNFLFLLGGGVFVVVDLGTAWQIGHDSLVDLLLLKRLGYSEFGIFIGYSFLIVWLARICHRRDGGEK